MIAATAVIVKPNISAVIRLILSFILTAGAGGGGAILRLFGRVEGDRGFRFTGGLSLSTEGIREVAGLFIKTKGSRVKQLSYSLIRPDKVLTSDIKGLELKLKRFIDLIKIKANALLNA
jgi:hypothetical protein